MKRLPHVVETASKMGGLDPSAPMVVQYWWARDGLGSFFPMPYTLDMHQPRWNLTECFWFVPGTVTE